MLRDLKIEGVQVKNESRQNGKINGLKFLHVMFRDNRQISLWNTTELICGGHIKLFRLGFC